MSVLTSLKNQTGQLKTATVNVAGTDYQIKELTFAESTQLSRYLADNANKLPEALIALSLVDGEQKVHEIEPLKDIVDLIGRLHADHVDVLFEACDSLSIVTQKAAEALEKK